MDRVNKTSVTLLNSTDAPGPIDTRTATSPEEFARQLDRRHDQLVTTIDNLLGMAERALDREDPEQARYFFDCAQPYADERDAIRSMRTCC